MNQECEHDLEPNKGNASIFAAVKVVEGNKNISFTSRHHNQGGGGVHKSKMSFKKECGADKDQIEIVMHKYEKRQRIKKCDLGHEHHVEDYEYEDWERIILNWEHMEQLIDWFKTGRFYDPRSRQARKRKDKIGFHSEKRLT